MCSFGFEFGLYDCSIDWADVNCPLDGKKFYKQYRGHHTPQFRGRPSGNKILLHYPTVPATPDGLGCDATLLINVLTQFLFSPRIVGTIDALEFL